jgi:predicted nucleic acid-binding Zn ribbon protein
VGLKVTSKLSEMLPETERTVSEARRCESCGELLAGGRPDTRFCSARCRKVAGRAKQRRAIATLLDTMQESLDVLRRELLERPSRISRGGDA